MNYTNLISRNKQYKYSSNVCFDLRNVSKLSDFIPNQTTTEILREYLGEIIKGTTKIHSRILYGSYGTGKSHLLTVLGAVFSRACRKIPSAGCASQFAGDLGRMMPHNGLFNPNLVQISRRVGRADGRNEFSNTL